MTLTKILSRDYESLDDIYKIVMEEHANNFAILKVKNINYGIAWYGNLITPVIDYYDRYDLFLVGVNQSAVAISGKDNRIVLCMGLQDNFSFFLKYEMGFGIVTETTVILLNGADLSLIRLITIPNIITTCSIKGDNIEIETLDNQHYSF